MSSTYFQAPQQDQLEVAFIPYYFIRQLLALTPEIRSRTQPCL